MKKRDTIGENEFVLTKEGLDQAFEQFNKKIHTEYKGLFKRYSNKLSDEEALFKELISLLKSHK
jgi:hypothetical protein